MKLSVCTAAGTATAITLQQHLSKHTVFVHPVLEPLSVCVSAASFPEGEDIAGSDGVVEVRMTVDESGDVSMLSGEVQKWFTLHAELPAEAQMDPALLIANTHILFNPKRGDIKVSSLLIATSLNPEERKILC